MRFSSLGQNRDLYVLFGKGLGKLRIDVWLFHIRILTDGIFAKMPWGILLGMSIIRRAQRKQNFTIIPNQLLEDGDLSWDSVGLLTFLLSKPDDWVVSIKHLTNLSRGAGDYALRRIFRELKTAGYVQGSQVRLDDGTLGYETVVYDLPFAWELDKSPGHPTRGLSTSGSPTSGSPTRGKSRCIVSTDSPSTEVLSTDETNGSPSESTLPLPEFDSPPPQTAAEKKAEDRIKYTEAYESVYTTYPRRVAKRDGLVAWLARIAEVKKSERDDLVADMTLGAANYAKHCQRERTEQKFIKHPKTFFGPGLHWKDYLDGPPVDPRQRRHNPMQREDDSSSGEVSIEEALRLK